MKNAMQHLLPVGLLCAMSAACAPEKVLSVQDYAATFLCDGSRSVRVRFAPFRAELESQGVAVAMVQQPETGGFRYTGGGHSLRQHGHEAVWTDDKHAVHHCRDDVPQGDANPIRALRAE
jgi:hypothetical protein